MPGKFLFGHKFALNGINRFFGESDAALEGAEVVAFENEVISLLGVAHELEEISEVTVEGENVGSDTLVHSVDGTELLFRGLINYVIHEFKH